LRVIGIDETADAVLGTRYADDDLVLHDERRDGDRITRLVVDELGIPERCAGPHVERQQVRIGRAEKEPIAQSPEAAIVRAAACPDVVGERSAMAPDLPSRARVERPRIASPSRDIQDAIDHDRRRLKVAEPGSSRLERPLRFELADVLGGDLRQRAMPMAEVVA
jgi:hypothetical protein